MDPRVEFDEWLDDQRQGLSSPLDRPADVETVIRALNGLGVVGRYIEILEACVRRARALWLLATADEQDGGILGDVMNFAYARAAPDDEDDKEDRAWKAKNAPHAANTVANLKIADQLMDDIYDVLCLRAKQLKLGKAKKEAATP